MERTKYITAWLVLAAGVLLLQSAPSTCLAAEGPGSTGASYLTLPVGTKSIAMGEVRAALTDDPFNWISNPGSMQYLSGSGAGLFHSQWIVDSKYNNIGLHHRFNDLFVMTGGFVYEYQPDIQGYDELGMETRALKNNQYQALLGFGFSPHESFTAGINIKYFREKLDENTAGGMGVDLGVLYTFPQTAITLGASVVNLGPEISFNSVKEPLPTTMLFGAGYSSPILMEVVKLSFAADLAKPKYSSLYLSAGAELELNEIIAFRAGYCGQEYRDGSGLTVGAGLKLKNAFRLDYAYTPYGDLGDFHRISLYFSMK